MGQINNCATFVIMCVARQEFAELFDVVAERQRRSQISQLLDGSL